MSDFCNSYFFLFIFNNFEYPDFLSKTWKDDIRDRCSFNWGSNHNTVNKSCSWNNDENGEKNNYDREYDYNDDNNNINDNDNNNDNNNDDQNYNYNNINFNSNDRRMLRYSLPE